jgi:hypothetical protein
MGGVVTEDQAISHAQYLDLVYSQSGTLYDLILHAPRMSSDQSKPSSDAHSDGIISSLKIQSSTQPTGKTSHSTSTPAMTRLPFNPTLLPLLFKPLR